MDVRTDGRTDRFPESPCRCPKGGVELHDYFLIGSDGVELAGIKQQGDVISFLLLKFSHTLRIQF